MAISDGFKIFEYSVPYLQKKLWANVAVDGNGCWEWQGYRSKNKKGDYTYGRIWLKNKEGDAHFRQVHRVAYALSTGQDIPPKLLICHTCDNPPCCNPTHLFKGTYADNYHDSVNKGRWHPMAPEQCPHAKLTWETVKTMRQLYSEGATQDELAAAFPVSQTNIGRMIRNEQWTVSDPTWTVRPHYGHSGRKGEDCSQAKLTQKQVDTIRERYVNGESQAALARQFGVCASTISFIILNQTWVTDTPIKSRGPTFYRAEENGNTKLTWELVYKIRELYPQGYTLKELAALTDIKSSSSIWRVVHNKVFFDSSYTPPPKIPRAETWKRRIRYRG